MTRSVARDDMAGFALRGPHVTLVPFEAAHITARYLGWLSDDTVNGFSKRFGAPPQSADDARAWLASLQPDETVLAIEVAKHGHVGNVKFGPIDEKSSRADISILIGERSVWGQGIGAEAVYLVTRHLFRDRQLNRVEAGSANPAFIRMVQKLGWRVEGTLRQRVRIGERLLDWTLLGQLCSEFRQIEVFETAKTLTSSTE